MLDAPAVILVRPTEEGNVGAAARAMANTGLTELVLVEPAPPIGRTARAFAVGAGGVLDRVRRAASLDEALGPFRRVVGTSSTRDRVPRQRLVTPRELAGRLAADPARGSTAIVFGPERSGLTGEELAVCDPIVRIPASPRQPTLNLAQAVLIVGYELYLAGAGLAGAGDAEAAAESAPPPATAAELAGLHRHLDRVLEAAGFSRDDTAAGVLLDVRRFLTRAAPTTREVAILRGVCRRLLHRLRHPGSPPRG